MATTKKRQWYAEADLSEVEQELATSATGLTQKVAEERLQRDGDNTINRAQGQSQLKVF